MSRRWKKLGRTALYTRNGTQGNGRSAVAPDIAVKFAPVLLENFFLGGFPRFGSMALYQEAALQKVAKQKEVALVSETGRRPIYRCLFAAFGPIPEGRHLNLLNRVAFPLQVLPAVLFLGI